MAELASIKLDGMHFRPSPDGKLEKMEFRDAKGRTVGVILPAAELRSLVNHMVDYVTKLEATEALAALPSDDEEHPLPATESAILHTKDLDLVRWQSGGCLLRIKTTAGVAIHLTLEEEHQRFLMHALRANLSSG